MLTSTGGASSSGHKVLERLRTARKGLAAAKTTIGRAVPSLRRALAESVRDGYDGGNDEYDGFCTDRVVVINLYPLTKRPELIASPTKLTHELVMTVTHELAHLLEKGGAHGASWRATHASLLQAVYCHVCAVGDDGALCAAASRCQDCEED